MKILIRKISIVLVIFAMSLLVSAYSVKTYNMTNLKENLCTPIVGDENYSSPHYLNLDKLPKDYGYELAIKNGDVVGRWGKVYNLEKLEKFIVAYESKTLNVDDMIRITTYSIEGEPLIKDLIFTEAGLKLIVDPRRNTFVNPEDIKIDEYNVTSILIEIKNRYRTYKVKIDSNKEINLIWIDKSLNSNKAPLMK
ncbi:hypothetical protein SDC9_156375 [bioreactor metagenome]|uniref:Uncharacterized protein n=1 Tax=bioreactor metagenome TaxID=1076179 RepID=A0A645F4J6_9ZZZZ